MKLPPPNDPSWKEFAEQHREFLNARPNYEKQMAARVQFFAELREQAAPNEAAGEEQPRHSQATAAASRLQLTERRDEGRNVPLNCPHATRSNRPTYLKARAAGVADDFPSEQQLPAEWFPGQIVTLHFTVETGVWKVWRTGTPRELVIQFWSLDEKPIGPPLIVAGKRKVVPVKGPSQLSKIDISMKHDSQDS